MLKKCFFSKSHTLILDGTRGKKDFFLIERKCSDNQHKVAYSDFLIVHYFSECAYMALQSSFNV